MFLRTLFTAWCLVLAGIGPALSQDGQIGIAFAQAPEQADGVCVGQNADKTLACAREKCVEGGALPRDCLRVRWCYPAGWSAVVSYQHQSSFHWHEYICGWPSKEAIIAAVAVTCDLMADTPEIVECSLAGLWDDNGRKLPAE